MCDCNNCYLDRNDSRLAKRAADSFGVNTQMDLVVEELAELIVALKKLRRGGYTLDAVMHVAEEHADVEFMLNQLNYMMLDGYHGSAYTQSLEYNRGYKRERLTALLDDRIGGVRNS